MEKTKFNPLKFKTKNLFEYREKDKRNDYLYFCKDSTEEGLTKFGLCETKRTIDFLVNSSWQKLLQSSEQIIIPEIASCMQTADLLAEKTSQALRKNLEIKICKDDDFLEIMKYKIIYFGEDFSSRFNEEYVKRPNGKVPEIHQKMLDYFDKNTLFLFEGRKENEQKFKLFLDKLTFIATPYTLKTDYYGKLYKNEKPYIKDTTNRVYFFSEFRKVSNTSGGEYSFDDSLFLELYLTVGYYGLNVKEVVGLPKMPEKYKILE